MAAMYTAGAEFAAQQALNSTRRGNLGDAIQLFRKVSQLQAEFFDIEDVGEKRHPVLQPNDLTLFSACRGPRCWLWC
jgi:hypothetical protein